MRLARLAPAIVLLGALGGALPNVLVLANTVYLHADWVHPFELTAGEPFHTPEGNLDVPTMQLAAELPYASGDGWQSVDLPYAQSDLVMRILLPTAGGDPAELLRSPVLAAPAQPRRLELHLPKWTGRSRSRSCTDRPASRSSSAE